MTINKKASKESEGIIEKFNIIEKIVKMLSSYGYKKVLSALLIFMLFTATIIIFTNQKAIVSRIVKEQTAAVQLNNAKNLEFRVKVVNPRVDAILYKLLVQTGADRAFVIEMHNGTDNPTGLPFAFGDMTYERLRSDSTESILNQYNRMNLSAIPMASYLCKNKRFFGTVEELSTIDLKISRRIKINGINFIGLYSVRGNEVEIGWVGISFQDKKPKNISNSEGCLLDASQRLSILLDISNNISAK